MCIVMKQFKVSLVKYSLHYTIVLMEYNSKKSDFYFPVNSFSTKECKLNI